MNLFLIMLATFMYCVIQCRRPRGRRECWEPTLCDDCGWAGPLRWTVHGYQDDGSGEDVEGCDYCPRCGSDQLDATGDV